MGMSEQAKAKLYPFEDYSPKKHRVIPMIAYIYYNDPQRHTKYIYICKEEWCGLFVPKENSKKYRSIHQMPKECKNQLKALLSYLIDKFEKEYPTANIYKIDMKVFDQVQQEVLQ